MLELACMSAVQGWGLGMWAALAMCSVNNSVDDMQGAL